jgi:hypothetical protein
MRVSLPFSYRLEYRLPRRKTSNREFFTDSISFDLPEISASETEVVAEWTNRPDHGGHTRLSARTWNGDLLVPTDTQTDVALKATDFPKHAGERVVSSRPFEALYGMRRGQMRYDTIHDTLFGVPRWGDVPRNIEVIQSTREEERLHAEALFAKLVSIDGKVWKRVPHVALSLVHCEPQGYLYASVEAGRTDLAHRYLSWADIPFWHTLNLPLDRVDIMDEFRSPVFVPEGAVKFLDVVIHDHDAIRFDPLHDFVTRGATEMISTGTPDIGDMPAEVIEGWLALRDIAQTAAAGQRREIADGDIAFFRDAFERLYLPMDRDAGLLGVEVGPDVRVNMATAETGRSYVLGALDKLVERRAEQRDQPGFTARSRMVR